MRVIDSGVRLSVAQTPRNFRAVGQGGAVSLECGPFQVSARCKLDADGAHMITPEDVANPRRAKWALGFMQLQIMEVLWAYYRGGQSGDGCALHDWTAFRTLKITRDYSRASGAVWYEGVDQMLDCYGLPDLRRPSPWNVEFYFGDRPHHDFVDHLVNPQTQRYNYFHEARWATAFLTTMTEQVTPGVYKHHRHFYWSAIWHVRSMNTEPQKSATSFGLLPGSGFWVSKFAPGAPVGTRYLAALNDPHLTPSTNDVVGMAHPAKTFAPTWQRFPLMDQKDHLF